MIHKILLPLDLTDKHQPALEAAVNFAETNAARIEVLHVIEVIAGLPMDEEKAFYQRLERAARKHLEKWGQRLAQRQIDWHAEIAFGQRALEIVRHAQEAGNDLIVLTVPRIMPENPGTSLGSLGYKVALLSHCPVLLVK